MVEALSDTIDVSTETPPSSKVRACADAQRSMQKRYHAAALNKEWHGLKGRAAREKRPGLGRRRRGPSRYNEPKAAVLATRSVFTSSLSVSTRTATRRRFAVRLASVSSPTCVAARRRSERVWGGWGEGSAL